MVVFVDISMLRFSVNMRRVIPTFQNKRRKLVKLRRYKDSKLEDKIPFVNMSSTENVNNAGEQDQSNGLNAFAQSLLTTLTMALLNGTYNFVILQN